MRGFVLGALVLIGLDVALTAPGSRITALVALPAGWLAEWMDPGRPLIGPGKLASTSSSSASTSSSAASSIGGSVTNALGAGLPGIGPFISGANLLTNHP